MAMRRIYIVLVFFLFCYTLHGQSISPYVVSTKGECFNNASSSITWTIGQIASKSCFSVDNILTQGFQQPYYYDPSDIPEQKSSTTEFQIYPNPTNDFVNVIYFTEIKTKLNIEVRDLLGNIVKPDTEVMSGPLEEKLVIKMRDLPSGVYLIKIFAMNASFVKTYKIIKIE